MQDENATFTDLRRFTIGTGPEAGTQTQQVFSLAIAPVTRCAMKLNPEPPEDFTRYNAIKAAAVILAQGDEDEWTYFLNQIRNETGDRGFVELMLKVRDEIKARIDGPQTPAEFNEEPSLFGDLPPGPDDDIPDVFKDMWEGER